DSVIRQIEVSINQSIVCFVIAIHGNWIPANPRFALPAGMTDFLVLGESFSCSVSRLKLVAKCLNLMPKLYDFINPACKWGSRLCGHRFVLIILDKRRYQQTGSVV
ncbi:MAG: hypothetical protein RIR39_489, partial [Pseudomonadota bacterium]